MNKKAARQKRIIEILRLNNGASIKSLSKELAASEMTIRRDLEQLNNENLVSLIHGAAIFNPESNEEKYNLSLETTNMEQQKERIGKAAAALIEKGDTIILDVGSTAQCVAKHIPYEYPISVMCFTVNTLNQIIKKNIKQLLFGGGHYHVNTQMFEGKEALDFVGKLRANKFFMSASGVSERLDITCTNLYEVDTKNACIECSQKKILLVDSSKLGIVKPAYFADLRHVDMVITDSGIPKGWIDIITSLNIELRIV